MRCSQKKRKKVELWQHNKSTNMVTNSKALSFGLSGLILLRTRDCCLTSLGVDGVGVRSAMVLRISRALRHQIITYLQAVSKKINLT